MWENKNIYSFIPELRLLNKTFFFFGGGGNVDPDHKSEAFAKKLHFFKCKTSTI